MGVDKIIFEDSALWSRALHAEQQHSDCADTGGFVPGLHNPAGELCQGSLLPLFMDACSQNNCHAGLCFQTAPNKASVLGVPLGGTQVLTKYFHFILWEICRDLRHGGMKYVQMSPTCRELGTSFTLIIVGGS